jgi:hypothetical protein
MRADPDRERRRAELAACAEEVFDALYPEDLAALVAAEGSRPALRDSVVKRAEKVVDKLGDENAPPGCHLVIAACFAWHRFRAGVAKNPGHAVKKLMRYRRCAEVPVGVLVRTDRIMPDDERTISLLALSLRVRAGLAEVGADREPELVLNMVVPAIVAALAPVPGPEAAALVGIALAVLDRGAELAAELRVARRLSRVPGTDLPVAGNADFLVRIAAYRVAIEEHRGVVVPRPLDAVEQASTALADILRKAMTRSGGRFNRRGPDEPDVVTAFNQYAGYLGAACGDDAGRRAASAVHSVLNYRLGLGEPPDETVVADIDSTALRPTYSAEAPSKLPEIEHLVGWLLAALFEGVGPEGRESLLAWLDGKHVPNESKNLSLLVRRLRIAGRVLAQCPESTPPRPVGITASRWQALTASLAAAVDPGGLAEKPSGNARHVMLSVLPPLWTRRRPAVHLVASHLRTLLAQRQSAHLLAMLVATCGVRGPAQFVQRTGIPLPGPCCPEAGGAGWSAPSGGPREPVDDLEVCPHRPWGEVGRVENYHTLGQAAGCSAEATRKHLERYQGPWWELLWDLPAEEDRTQPSSSSRRRRSTSRS